MSNRYKDRFSEAIEELEEKSSFICKSCKTKYGSQKAKEKNLSCCGRTLSEFLQESFGP